MAFNPENNPLNGVRVEIPEEKVIRNIVLYDTPAEKNFKEAERRTPKDQRTIKSI